MANTPSRGPASTPKPEETPANLEATPAKHGLFDSEPNIAEGGRAATHRDQLPTDRPGFHCGYCGEPVGPEGQHWDESGDVRENGHAGTMVVADNWPEKQDEQDAEKREAEQAKRDEINGIKTK